MIYGELQMLKISVFIFLVGSSFQPGSERPSRTSARSRRTSSGLEAVLRLEAISQTGRQGTSQICSRSNFQLGGFWGPQNQ